MLLFCCHTPAHRVLFENSFLPSVPAGMEVQNIELGISGRGDFLSEEFLQCIRAKIELIRRSIDDHPGEIIVWSDVDIRFHRPIAGELESLLASSGHSILFQREDRVSREVNTGFFACRCDERVAALFDRVRDLLAAHPDWNEQRAVNDLIASGEMEHFGHLPANYYARTHGWPPPRDARIHHANYTKGADGVGQKIRQFSDADDIMAGGFRRWLSLARAAAALGPAGLLRAILRRLR